MEAVFDSIQVLMMVQLYLNSVLILYLMNRNCPIMNALMALPMKSRGRLSTR